MRRYLVIGLTLLAHISSATEADTDEVCVNDHRSVTKSIETCRRVLADENLPLKTEVNAGINLIALYTRNGDFELANQMDARLNNQLDKELLTPEQAFDYLRRSGILAYRQGEYAQSLGRFQAAERIAEGEPQQARVFNDLGTVNMAMGQFSDALSAFQSSLKIKQSLNNPISTAVTFNNIGTVYLKMSEWSEAELYFKKAADIYRDNDANSRLSHTNENVAKALFNQSKYLQAIEVLEDSLSYHRESQDRTAMLRVLIHLSEIYLALGDPESAEGHLKLASVIDTELGQNAQSILLKLVMGKFLSKQGQFQQADALLNAGLAEAKTASAPETVNEIYDALIANAEVYHRWQTSARYLKNKAEFASSQFQQTYDEALARVRTEFEYEQQQQAYEILAQKHQIKALEANDRKYQLIWLTAFSTLTLILLMLMVRYQQLKRRTEKQELNSQVELHRSQVNALGVSLDSLQTAMSTLHQAMLVADNHDRVIFANQSCCAMLEMSSEQLDSLELNKLITTDNESFWLSLSSDSELDELKFHDIRLTTPVGEKLCQLEVSHVDGAGSVTVIRFMQANEDSLPHATALLSETEFHQLLVDLMVYTVESWEQSTQQSRIELAEQSGIWRVSIDEGRLRTRSLDRYLSIRSLPKKPRWREVLRTGHYVLAECELTKERREELDAKLERVNQHLHARALL